jgi:misacylated tRNA(Ala) deacylase
MYVNNSMGVEYAFVKSIQIDNEISWVGLSISSIRPRYGGQLEDRAHVFINGKWVSIVGVRFSSFGVDVAVPTLESNISTGDLILVKKDISYNHCISRIHSAIHLLCALSNHEMLNAYSGDKIGRVDFLGDSNEFNRNLIFIEAEFRRLVNKAINISEIYASKEEIIELGNVKEFGKADLSLYRIISIDGVDKRICMGSHVSNTKEIGEISIGVAKKCSSNSYKVNILCC